MASKTLSPSSSSSLSSGIPSRSRSAASKGSKGKPSSPSRMPSSSVSGSLGSVPVIFSAPSLSPSLSESGLKGSVPFCDSSVSGDPSLSSSVSVMFPIPSLSKSAYSLGSRGNSSIPSLYPSSSVSEQVGLFFLQAPHYLLTHRRPCQG